MKKFVFAGLAAMSLGPGRLEAQPVMHIGSSADFYIAAHEKVALDGLVLSPSSDFTLLSNTLTRKTTLSNGAENPQSAIQRTYLFAQTTPPYTGSIRLYYTHEELNGTPEDDLVINAYTGSRWSYFTTAAFSEAENYVEADAVDALTLNEITATASNAILPVQWGTVEAVRRADAVELKFVIMQGSSQSHFDIERMQAGQASWETAVAAIPAVNTSQPHTYTAYDGKPPAEKLFYRIRQTDKDGRYTFSGIVAVAPSALSSTAYLYPNPAGTFFRLKTSRPEAVSFISLLNAAGAELQRFSSYQAIYPLPHLTRGIYQVVIHYKEGTREVLPLVK